jgi:UDP:flavonoid glycosyltransferase YjiC (YdhE family)
VRVLVISTAGIGHIYPMVPLASVLRSVGHDLLWAVPPEGLATIESLGMRVQSAGVTQRAETPEAKARRAEMMRRLANTDPSDHNLVVWPSWFVGAQGAAMLADLRPTADSWRPELIIHEPNAVAAAPLAARRGIPRVVVGYGGFVRQAVFDAAEQEFQLLWGAEGLELRPYAGLYDDLYLHPFPDSFGPPPPARTVRHMRPLGFDGSTPSQQEPEWVGPLGKSRPCVYVTFGTVLAAQAPFPALFEAFSQLHVDAVVTVGPVLNIDSLPPHPPNVRIAGYVPQRFLMERSSLVVSHTGSGTLLGALSRGIPQLCTPTGADQFLNADAITASGCGLALNPAEVTTAAILASAHRLLDDPLIASRSRTVADQIRLMPEPQNLVGMITRPAPIQPAPSNSR